MKNIIGFASNLYSVMKIWFLLHFTILLINSLNEFNQDISF